MHRIGREVRRSRQFTPLRGCFAVLLLGVTVSPAVFAQATVAPDEGSDRHIDERLLEEIVVIGTRRGERSAGELQVPVDVLDGDTLRAAGNGDMLDTLTALIPSYNVGREPISDAATLIRPANLRGLPADSTLVLVNGKRRHRGAVIGEFVAGFNKGAQAVDIVPLADIALKRVEILRDGASAQYGSDAVAGVLNFVLEDNPNVRRLRLRYGSTYEGDGDRITASGAIGTQLGDTGFATLAFELQDSAPTSRGSQDPQATFLVENGYTGVADPVVVWGSPEVENDFKVLANAAAEAGTGELYGFGAWSGRDVDGSFFYRNPNTRSGVFADGTGHLLVADLTPSDGSACRPVPIVEGLADRAALQAIVADPNCFAYNEWFPSGFTPRFGGKVSDASLVLGWRGDRPGGFTYDLSASAGRSEVIYRIRRTINASYGPNTPTAFDLGAQVNIERLLNGDFAFPVGIGAASDLHVAFGAQYHEEAFGIVAGDTASWAPGGFETQGFSVGANGFQGFSTDVAGRFSRDSFAAYVQLDVDVTGRWVVDGAARYERYSDFGSTANGKFATRFQVLPAFALRGSVSTGFRAPSVGQSNLRRAATTFRGGMLAESLTLPPTDPVAALKGGRALDPEESVNLTAGAVFAAGPLRVMLDWFRIAVDGRFALTEQRLSAQDRADLVAAAVVGAQTVSAVTFFINDIGSRTTGLDLVIETDFDWAGARAGVTLAANVIDTDITDRGVTLTEAGAKELEEGLPDSRATLTFDYARGDWTGLVRLNRYGEVYEHLFNCETCAIETDALTVLDAQLTRALTDTWALTLGARNLLDERPDRHRFAGVAGYLGADYPLTHPAGFDGGGYYVRVAARW